MTALVNHDTGEVVETIGADVARQLTTEAQNEFRSGAAHTARGWELVEQAVLGGGHVDLGYRSPGDYLAAEFDGILSGFNITERRLAVRTMTSWGLSTRAIAPALGVDQKTVSNDRRAGEELSSPATPTPASASEGEAAVDAGHTPQGEDAPGPVAATPVPSSPIEPHTSTTPRPADPQPVIGIDGKTYKRPEPKPRATPRKPLPDQFRDRLYDLTLKVESLHRLTEDDRWTTNAKKLATVKNRNELLRINDLLQQVINSLPENEVTS